jgi:hypothetical protein
MPILCLNSACNLFYTEIYFMVCIPLGINEVRFSLINKPNIT